MQWFSPMKNCMQNISKSLKGDLEKIIEKHFIPTSTPTQNPDAQFFDKKWWIPMEGCDTLERLVEDLEHFISRKIAYNYHVVFEIERSKNNKNKNKETILLNEVSKHVQSSEHNHDLHFARIPTLNSAGNWIFEVFSEDQCKVESFTEWFKHILAFVFKKPPKVHVTTFRKSTPETKNL